MFVSVSKTEKGDVLIRFGLPTLPIGLMLRWIVETLTVLFTFITSQYYVILMGLGIGIGMSMSSTVLNSPLSASATATNAIKSQEIYSDSNTSGIQPEYLELSTASSQVFTLDNWSDLRWAAGGKVHHYKNSAVLHQLGQIIFMIGLQNPTYPDFADLSLGESITITGENNGVYIFQSIEIRELSAIELSTIFSASETYKDKVLFVFKSPGFNTQFTVVIANKLSSSK